jgi:hypothetical protein
MPTGHEHLVEPLSQDPRFMMMRVFGQRFREKLRRSKAAIGQRLEFRKLDKAFRLIRLLILNVLKIFMTLVEGARKVFRHGPMLLILRKCEGPTYPLRE